MKRIIILSLLLCPITMMAMEDDALNTQIEANLKAKIEQHEEIKYIGIITHLMNRVVENDPKFNDKVYVNPISRNTLVYQVKEYKDVDLLSFPYVTEINDATYPHRYTSGLWNDVPPQENNSIVALQPIKSAVYINDPKFFDNSTITLNVVTTESKFGGAANITNNMNVRIPIGQAYTFQLAGPDPKLLPDNRLVNRIILPNHTYAPIHIASTGKWFTQAPHNNLMLEPEIFMPGATFEKDIIESYYRDNRMEKNPYRTLSVVIAAVRMNYNVGRLTPTALTTFN